MIVVDSSAVIAILFGEPSAERLASRLAADPDRVISAASYLEAGTVLAGRRLTDRPQAIADLDAFLTEAGIEVAQVDAAQARIALTARITYGRGMGHGGLLNSVTHSRMPWLNPWMRRYFSSATAKHAGQV